MLTNMNEKTCCFGLGLINEKTTGDECKLTLDWSQSKTFLVYILGI